MPTPTKSVLSRKEPSTCGGETSLQQCGASFPSDFCCPQSSTCLQLESDAIAVLCCPAGQECTFVSPINCDQAAQNATIFPGNQLHSDPTLPLEECGDACCPDGSTCHNGICAIQVAMTTTTSTSTPAPTSTSSEATSSSISATTSTTSLEDAGTSSLPSSTTSNASKALEDVPIQDAATKSSDNFSGTSFVAGFLPGIVIGVIAVALLMWCLDRRRRRRRDSQYTLPDQKHFSTADQLTSLGADPYRPPMHTRSISEPVVDPSNSHRTDFVRGTPSPPRNVDPLNHNAGGYTATASGPITPARTPKIRALFTRSSIFQSPPSPQTTHFPSQLKRGTLTHAYSYTISPIRALRPKKSSHSLRRQMTADAAIPPATVVRTTTSSSQQRPRASTHGSTETIQVLMPRVELEACTPDQRSQNAASDHGASHNQHISSRHSDLTWATVSSSPLYPAPIRRQNEDTPTRVPASQARDANRSLGTPYTPSRPGGQQSSLTVSGREADARRQTTFSGFMERAGIRPGGV